MEKPEEIRESFEKAYEELLEPLFRYFSFRFDDRDRARELAQETFMKTWTYLQQGREIKALKPFLYATAGNLFKNELRAKRSSVSLETLMESHGFDAHDEKALPEEAAEARLLMGKLDGLAERHREILMLRYVDGLTNPEIAKTLGIGESAAGVRIHRALAKLRVLHEGTP